MLNILYLESLQAEMVKQGAMAVFLNCVKAFIEKDSEMTELVISALCALACSGKSKFLSDIVLSLFLSFKLEHNAYNDERKK